MKNSVNSEFRDAQKESFKAAWDDLPSWVMTRSLTRRAGTFFRSKTLQSGRTVFEPEAPTSPSGPSSGILRKSKEATEQAMRVVRKGQLFAICVGFVFLTTAGQLSLERSKTHELYDGAAKQVFTSIYFLVVLIIGMVPQCLMLLGMMMAKAQEEKKGLIATIRANGLHTADLGNVFLVATLFTINDYSRINAIVELGALNTVILSAPEVLIIAAMEIKFLNATYNEIHFSLFTSVGAITLSMALLEANSGSSKLAPVGLAWVAVHVVLKCLAGVYNSMFLKGKGGHWMLKVLTESVVMAAVMVTTAGILLVGPAADAGLSFGSVLQSMDTWAFIGASFMGLRMLSVAFILKKLSPLSKVISQSFIGGCTAIGAWLLTGEPVTVLDGVLLLALASITFSLNRLTGKLQMAYKVAKEDMTEVMRDSFKEDLQKQQERNNLKDKSSSEALGEFCEAKSGGFKPLRAINKQLTRAGTFFFGGKKKESGAGGAPLSDAVVPITEDEEDECEELASATESPSKQLLAESPPSASTQSTAASSAKGSREIDVRPSLQNAATLGVDEFDGESVPVP